MQSQDNSYLSSLSKANEELLLKLRSTYQAELVQCLILSGLSKNIALLYVQSFWKSFSNYRLSHLDLDDKVQVYRLFIKRLVQEKIIEKIKFNTDLIDDIFSKKFDQNQNWSFKKKRPAQRNEEYYSHIDMCLERLPFIYRLSLSMHYFGQLSILEISEVLELKYYEAQQIFSRSFLRIRECLLRKSKEVSG